MKFVTWFILAIVLLGIVFLLTGCGATRSYTKSFTLGIEYNDIRANARWDYGQSGKRVVRAQK